LEPGPPECEFCGADQLPLFFAEDRQSQKGIQVRQRTAFIWARCVLHGLSAEQLSRLLLLEACNCNIDLFVMGTVKGNRSFLRVGHSKLRGRFQDRYFLQRIVAVKQVKPIAPIAANESNRAAARDGSARPTRARSGSV